MWDLHLTIKEKDRTLSLERIETIGSDALLSVACERERETTDMRKPHRRRTSKGVIEIARMPLRVFMSIAYYALLCLHCLCVWMLHQPDSR